MDNSSSTTFLPGLLLVIACLAGFALVGGTGPATGSDVVSLFDYDPENQTVEQGATMTVGVDALAGGASRDAGVDRVNVTVVYDGSALSLRDVERGGWMGQGEETTVETTVDIENDRGRARFDRSENPRQVAWTGVAGSPI